MRVLSTQSSVAFLLIFFVFPSTALGASFVVGANGDFGDQTPGNGICDTFLGSSPPYDCTLRAAIEEANAHSGNDTITFISKFTFNSTFLPEITGDGLTIDGSSQWDTALGIPGIEITAAPGENGLTIGGSNNAIKGIIFHGSGKGIHVTGSGSNIGGSGQHERNVFLNGNAIIGNAGVYLDSSSRSTVVQYNYFGTKKGENWGADDFYRGNIGVMVFGSGVGAGTIIEHNIIGEQATAGIFLEGCGAVKIRNNNIGIFVAASNSTLPNRVGIEFHDAKAEVTGNTISNNTIGQIYTSPGNASGAPIISDNTIGSHLTVHSGSNPFVQGGIHLGLVNDPPAKTVITGNSIRNTALNGISVGGLSGGIAKVEIENNLIFNNQKDGIFLSYAGSGSKISGNRVMNNASNGIVLSHTQNVVVTNNSVGLSDFTDEGNGSSGIRIENASTDNQIGGFDQGSANYIGYNDASGIYITDTGTRDNVVIGNVIGSSKPSSNKYFKAGNGHHGIAIYNNAESNDIGVSGSSIIIKSPNLILDSGWRGIAVINSNHNRIFSNDIGTDGISRNWGNKYSGIQVVGHNNVMKYNRIANNGFGPVPPQAGVVIQDASSFNNQISENSIYKNGTKGIELINSANQSILPPTLEISGSLLSGKTYPNSTVEFFSGIDQDEGAFFEGSIQADSSGNFSFTKKGSFRADFVTATTTLPVNFSTSEFSLPVKADTFPWFLFLPATLK